MKQSTKPDDVTTDKLRRPPYVDDHRRLRTQKALSVIILVLYANSELLVYPAQDQPSVWPAEQWQKTARLGSLRPKDGFKLIASFP